MIIFGEQEKEKDLRFFYTKRWAKIINHFLSGTTQAKIRGLQFAFLSWINLLRPHFFIYTAAPIGAPGGGAL